MGVDGAGMVVGERGRDGGMRGLNGSDGLGEVESDDEVNVAGFGLGLDSQHGWIS